MNKCLFSSCCGPLLLIAHQESLVYCNWVTSECQSKQIHIEKLFQDEKETTEDQKVLNETTRQLKEYFSGLRLEFDIPLRLIGTDFQKKVWNLLNLTPYGTTITYKELSRRFGNPKAIRAIAQACGANPISIIVPCHRIVSSNGKSGGYTGGVDKKIVLLSLERTTINNNNHQRE
ncbi:MAG: methylated-DNA--[protein]-cysteine S-methyltransferase [Muribaculaceae bacterium]|nr:methylated-DNA--[protein]-cysteine S-methyltransferase [Muribaculaceae bacterium]